MTSPLTTIFACANQLTIAEPSPDLRTALSNRLCRYYELRGSKRDDLENLSLSELQLLTADEALNTVSDVHKLLSQDTHAEGQGQDVRGALGTRDLARLRTLISIVFKWGVETLLSRCLQIWPTKLGESPGVTPSEEVLKQYNALVAMTNRLMGMIFPRSSGPPSITHVTAAINDGHLIDLLRPCLALGWLPKSLSTEYIVSCDSLRLVTLRLLSILPPSQSIVALGGVLSSKPVPSLHMRRICTMLLGKQITRTRGVDGLCVAIFGDEDGTGDEAPLEKLEHIARVLLTVPQGIQPQDFYRSITDQILSLLSEKTAPTHKRAVAFTVSRMLATEESSHPYVEIGSQLLLSSLHDSLIPANDAPLNAETAKKRFMSILLPSVSISALATLVTNMDPYPASISRLLSPIVPVLYSLLYRLDQIRTSDPTLRDSVHGLLVTWGKIVEKSGGLDCIWLISQSDEIYWNVGLDGDIRQVHKPDKTLPLSFFTPESLEEAENSGSLDDDANIMGLYPDPVHYVRFLKELDRTDISSDLFVKFLESYREQRSTSNADPLRTLLTMQIVMQMQKQLSTGPSSSNFLCKPAYMLLFVKHVLESSSREQNERLSQKKPALDKRTEIVSQPSTRLEEIEDIELADSDDEASGPEVISSGDEMIETAINLLLSILEANEGLSARTMPVLNDIYSLLDPFSRDQLANIRAVAREAKMVMTARLASTSTDRRLHSSEEESSQEVYQKALKLLQDPILPVRSHGLLLLRQLVTRSKGEVDSALIPAILSIFLQAVQDDESYLFLNAVQGLAAMVDSYGKDVLKALVRDYTGGLVNSTGGGDLSQHGLDVRIRIGEALGIVIRRMGTALGIYSDLLVPPLFQIVRSPDVPTVLRTSSLSLLADCVNIYALAILPYVTDLAETMVDFLHIEAVPVTDGSSTRKTQYVAEVVPPKEVDRKPSMDSQPTSTNPRFPPLRRAALHFLSLLVRSMTEYVYENSPTGMNIPVITLRRAKTVLAYVASTDEDNLVRIMAREAGEGLQQLQQALFDL
ncbi:hypothetical protein JOM56_008618 [Amanita muscaria]